MWRLLCAAGSGLAASLSTLFLMGWMLVGFTHMHEPQLASSVLITSLAVGACIGVYRWRRPMTTVAAPPSVLLRAKWALTWGSIGIVAAWIVEQVIDDLSLLGLTLIIGANVGLQIGWHVIAEYSEIIISYDEVEEADEADESEDPEAADESDDSDPDDELWNDYDAAPKDAKADYPAPAWHPERLP